MAKNPASDRLEQQNMLTEKEIENIDERDRETREACDIANGERRTALGVIISYCHVQPVHVPMPVIDFLLSSPVSLGSCVSSTQHFPPLKLVFKHFYKLSRSPAPHFTA